MSDNKYTPKGITPLPWLRDRRCIYALTPSKADGRPINRFWIDVQGQPWAGTTDEELDAIAAYAQHAANEYPGAIDALRDVVDWWDNDSLLTMEEVIERCKAVLSRSAYQEATHD